MSNPVLLVASLASSLAYTDRAGAGTLTGVDPIRYDNGLWVEQGTSNYARNQVAKNDTVQWGVDSTATWTRETTLPGPLPGWLAPLVTTCFKFTATANIVGASSLVYTTNDAVPGAGTYIPAAYIWVPSSYGAAPLAIHGAAYTGGTTSEGSVDLGLRDQWQLCQGEQVVVGGDLAGVLGVVLTGGTIATGESFYLTLAMFQPAPLTSPAVGSFGTGYAFAGTVERSTSTRAASSASVATANHLDPATGAIAFRVTPTIETGLEELWGECGVKGSGTDHLRWGRDSSTHPYVEWSSNDAAYQRLTGTETLAAGVECLFYTDWDGTIIRLSIDNGTIQTDTRDAVSDSWGAGDFVLKAE